MEPIEWAMHHALQADKMVGQLLGHIFDTSRGKEGQKEGSIIDATGDIRLIRKYLDEVENGLKEVEH